MSTDPIPSLRTDFQDVYDLAYAGWHNYLREAVTDMEIHLGAQFNAEETAWAEANDRILYPFGKSARQVALLHGYEIRNRHLLKIGPVGREDDNACRQHTALLLWQMNAYGGYETLSDAFKWGSLVTGSNLFEFWRDRDSQIRFGRRSFNAFLLDPGLSRTDLTDCGFIICGRWLDDAKIKALLPLEADRIDQIPYTEFSMRWNRAPHAHDKYKNRQRLYEEWYRPQTRLVPHVVSRLSGGDVSLADLVSGAAKGQMDERAVNYLVDNSRLPNGMPIFSRFQKSTQFIQLTILVDGEPVYDGEQPLKLDEYPFVWLHGEWMPECDRDEIKLQSFTRGLRSTTRARNRRINQLLDIIERQIQNLRLIREDSLVDKEDAYRSGQTHPIVIKKKAQGALLGDHFVQVPSPDIPAGLFAICELLEKEETQVKGLNDEIFGSDDKENVPGILARFRTGQALTGQAGIFDSYREAKRQIGRKAVKLNQAHMKDSQVARILNEAPDPTFREPDFAKYDCTPVEGLLTDTQMEMAYQELAGLCQAFPQLLQLIPPSMLVGMSPISFKPELMNTLKRGEQQQAQQQQLAYRNQEIMNRLIESQSAMGIAKTKSEMAGASLDMAKTMTEIQNLKSQPSLEAFDRVIRLLEIAQKAQQMQQKPQMEGSRK
jgi:hypothetical protein